MSDLPGLDLGAGSSGPIYIIDTSVAVQWYVPEVHSTEARRYMGPGIERHAPEILPLEGAHALLKRSRGQKPDLTPAVARTIALTLRDQAPITYHPGGPLLEAAMDLAYEIGSSSYDGLFLALAIRLDGWVVTADRKFFDKIAASPHAARGRWFLDPP